jgi:hypothetical protein
VDYKQPVNQKTKSLGLEAWNLGKTREKAMRGRDNRVLPEWRNPARSEDLLEVRISVSSWDKES